MKKIEIAKKYFNDDELKRLISLCEIYCIDGFNGELSTTIKDEAEYLIRVYAYSHGLNAVFSETYTEKIQFYDSENWENEFRIDGLFLRGVIEE